MSTLSVESSPDHNLASLLERRAAAHGSRLCLAVPRDRRAREHEEVRFSELRERTLAVAAALSSAGIARGDVVVLMQPMSTELYTLLLATFRLGAVAAFIDPWMPGATLDEVCRWLRPRAFIGPEAAHLLRLRARGLLRIPLALCTRGRVLGVESLAARIARAGPAPPMASVREDDTALVTFTTGSSGRPKGSDRTHGHLLAQQRVLARALGPEEDSVDLPALPIFTLNTLAAGATAVLPAINVRRPSAVDPEIVLGQMRAYGVEQSTASPAFFLPIARHLLASGAKGGPLRRVYTGGAPVPLSLAAMLVKLLGEEGPTIVYGSTEAEPISLLPCAEMLALRARTEAGEGVCVGRLIEDIELALLPSQDRPLALADVAAAGVARGQAGEVVVAGPHVNTRYFHDDEAFTRHKIVDAKGRIWHRTGDLGALDDEGRLWIQGSVTSSVAAGGRLLHAVAVEEAARSVPGVRRAALVPGPRGQGGQVVIEPEGPLSLLSPLARARLKGAVRAHLEEIGLGVDEVRLDPKLPTDPRHNAKVDRRRLSARHGGTRGRLLGALLE